MANVCAPELTALRRPLHTGLLPACVAIQLALASCGIPDSSSNMTVTLFNELIIHRLVAQSWCRHKLTHSTRPGGVREAGPSLSLRLESPAMKRANPTT